MPQRLGLAKALLHHPRLVILDEPANGLDPAGIVEIRELLIDLTRNQGVTVFMSSHILEEVNRLADRIGIIHQGRLIQELNREELEQNRLRTLRIGVEDIQAAESVLRGAGLVPDPCGEKMIAIRAGEAIDHPERVNLLLTQAGQTPHHLAVDEEDLEDYFLRLVGVEGGQE